MSLRVQHPSIAYNTLTRVTILRRQKMTVVTPTLHQKKNNVNNSI